jgi:hypothetical protein
MGSIGLLTTTNLVQRNFRCNCMEQSASREANSRSAGQTILQFVWSAKFYHSAHKISPLVPLLSQINPIIINEFQTKIQIPVSLTLTVALSDNPVLDSSLGVLYLSPVCCLPHNCRFHRRGVADTTSYPGNTQFRSSGYARTLSFHPVLKARIILTFHLPLTSHWVL